MRNSTGSKYDSSLSKKEIAKRMRADIKAAIADGILPKGIKVSVRMRGYNAIDLSITAFPGDVFDQDKNTFTPAIQAALSFLKDVHNAYNFDKSDIMSDYFNVNYYGDARVDWQLERDARK